MELQKYLLHEREVSLYFLIFREVLRVKFNVGLALGVWVVVIPQGQTPHVTLNSLMCCGVLEWASKGLFTVGFLFWSRESVETFLDVKSRFPILDIENNCQC